MQKNILRLCCLLLLLYSACFAANQKIVPTNSKKPIVISKKNPQFTIIIPANHTTGYMWWLNTYNHDLLQPVSQTYNVSQQGLIGAGGYEIWKFKLKPSAFAVPQVTKIVLIYARTWEVRSVKSIAFVVKSYDS